MAKTRNASAFERTLTALRDLGRIEDVDGAQVALCRSLAESVDAAPFDAQLWRQYREALRELTEQDDVVDGRLEAALAQIGSRSPLGNQPPG